MVCYGTFGQFACLWNRSMVLPTESSFFFWADREEKGSFVCETKAF